MRDTYKNSLRAIASLRFVLYQSTKKDIHLDAEQNPTYLFGSI